ncbi:MAG: hypothetical protein U0002_17300 [Thermoanaerobaculia bacterium]
MIRLRREPGVEAKPLAPARPEPDTAPFSLASWLRCCRPHLPPTLVSKAAFEQAALAAESFPPGCLGILELRLATGAPQVDLAARLAHPGEAAQVQLSSGSPSLERLLRGGWQELGFPHPVSALWLELDLPPGATPAPPPILCARLADPVPASWLVEVLVPALRGRRTRGREARLLERCLEALPPGVQLFYLFHLASRPGQPLRLELASQDSALLLSTLRRIGPEAAVRSLQELLPLLPRADRCHLSFDLGGENGDEILPHPGLEASFRHQPPREPRWSSLLRHLVQQGLACDEKAQALLHWPGTETLLEAPERWPREAIGQSSHLVRALSHVKVGRGQAKAYLAFRGLPSPVPAAATSQRAASQ